MSDPICIRRNKKIPIEDRMNRFQTSGQTSYTYGLIVQMISMIITSQGKALQPQTGHELKEEEISHEASTARAPDASLARGSGDACNMISLKPMIMDTLMDFSLESRFEKLFSDDVQLSEFIRGPGGKPLCLTTDLLGNTVEERFVSEGNVVAVKPDPGQNIVNEDLCTRADNKKVTALWFTSARYLKALTNEYNVIKNKNELKNDLELNQLPDQALYLNNAYDVIDSRTIKAVLTRDEFSDLNFDPSVVVTYRKPPLTCRLERVRRSPTPEI
ncbi:hypothetical protein PENSPDRAFT_671102 [Peniophora sp. CONT]|nr:hypothetical protein PENSPDRAFT_671102 [Peniophora sp. CONT]